MKEVCATKSCSLLACDAMLSVNAEVTFEVKRFAAQRVVVHETGSLESTKVLMLTLRDSTLLLCS